MNARNAIFVLLVLLGIAAAASSAYALSADTFGCPAACGGQGTVPSAECKPTMTSLTVNGAPFDSTKVYTVAELLSPNTCIEFTTPCQFQMATFEVWNTKEAHATCASRDYTQLVTLSFIGAKGDTLDLKPIGNYKICATANTMSQTSKSRINSAPFTGRNFRAELCPKENAPECKAGCGWLEIIPQGQGEAPPVGCPQGCDDKNPCTEDVCEVSTCVFKKETMEGKQVTVEGKTCMCKDGVAKDCVEPAPPELYISKIASAGATLAEFGSDFVGAKKAEVALNSTFDISVEKVSEKYSTYLVKGSCPESEPAAVGGDVLSKKDASAVVDNGAVFQGTKASLLSNAQLLSVCQYMGTKKTSDSVTMALAVAGPPCTNLICALAKIDIRFVLDIFK